MNQDTKVVKISDVIENQIPEFISSENPNLSEFLKQYYLSQEYQGGSVDLAENIIDYKNVDSFDSKNLIQNTNLTQEVSYFDDVINVESTNGWPKEYGLLKIDNEIITYTGITTNTFTGCIRGFSGIESLTQDGNPEYLKFSSSEVSEHTTSSAVFNLSNLFLLEFLKKIKYQFTPGFEELNFDSKIDIPNFISKVKSFYQSKGTDEAFRILFAVLFDEPVQVIKPKDYLFTSSDDQWIVVERFIGELVSGNAFNLNGQTLYQDENGSILPASGSIYKVSSATISGKQYYNIDLFSGYSNNLNPKGSISGEFEVTPQTYTNLQVNVGDTTISAVSTIGFENSGTLEIDNQVITYTDKTNTEFLNCSGIVQSILQYSIVYASNYVYSYEDGDSDKLVKFRLLNTLSNIDTNNAILASDNDLLKINNLGTSKENIFTKSLIYNVPSSIFIGKVFETIPQGEHGIGTLSGQVITKYPHYLKNGDVIEIFSITENKKLYDSVVTNISDANPYSFAISAYSDLKLNHKIKARRKVIKSKSVQYPEINNKFSINIQNSYEDRENYYIESNGIYSGNLNPYKREYIFNVEPSNSGISTVLTGTHNFYDGEIVKVSDFTPSGGFDNVVGIYTGMSLYVKKIDNANIKLCFTPYDVITNNYINFAEDIGEDDEQGYIENIKLIYHRIYDNDLSSSKLLKKIPKEVKYSTSKSDTLSGPVGVLKNGVEIQNYKSFDNLYYGEIQSINVINSGNGYSLINTPRFSVDFGNDQNAILTPELVGSVKSLVVTNPGFDYIETPVITIKGGGNDLIRTEVKIKDIQKEIYFNSQDSNVVVTTNPFNRFIFNEPHRLVPGDAVLYESFNNTPITGLNNNSIYYIFDVGAGTSFKLAYTKNDALSGIGTIDISSGGEGYQRFTAIKKSKVIDSVEVLDVENEFKYKKLPLRKININNYDDIIEFKNHGFNDFDEVQYSYTQNSILNSNQYYYVLKLDDNRFKLSSTKDLNTLVSFGSPVDGDIHYISYSPIRVEIKGLLTTLGISTIGVPAEVYPNITGSIKKVNVINSNQYGSTIFNFENAPKIELLKGKYASLKAVVSNGKIVKVIVLNQGQDYFNSIKIEAIGSGVGAKFHPVIVNGQITEVKVLSSGIGYNNYTKLSIISEGNNAYFKANIKKWTINELSKDYVYTYKNNGILINQKYYNNVNGIGIYELNDKLTEEFGITSSGHSPIIGWAYDGCPIYGPYAYENVDGTGNIVRMISGYKKVRQSPIISNSSDIDCIEDYSYDKTIGTLDEFNGRYCVTPEYPNGVYAYFCTSTFPYFIGPQYKFTPVTENTSSKYNQDLNLNSLDIVKYTLPYYVEDKNNYYEYFNYYPNTSREDFIVLNTLPGQIEAIEIVSSGNNYSIGDNIVFDNEDTDGFGAFGEVSQLKGVGVSSIYSESKQVTGITFIQNDNKIIGIASENVSLVENYFVNIINVSSEPEKIEGIKKIKFNNPKSKTLNYVAANSGIITSIKINDSITNFDIDSKIKIGSEIVTIIGFDYQNNSITILRENDSSQISAQTEIQLLNNIFSFETNQKLKSFNKNESYYFDSNLVSLGTNSTPGSGNTLIKYPVGYGVSETRFVKTGAIWMPNHRFKHGEKVIYSNNENSSNILTSFNGETDLQEFDNLYILDFGNDLIGLTNDISTINSYGNILYFTDAGTGSLHRLKTDRQIITGDIFFNETTVYTNSEHGLKVDDEVNIDVMSGSTQQFNVEYDSINAKLLINSQNNPRIDSYRNQILEFDISSPSLVDCIFKLYIDEDFENEYVGNIGNGIEVLRTETKLTLTINKNTPTKLYYNLETANPLYPDESIFNHNVIDILPSKFNSTSGIVTTTQSSFKVNLASEPESISYVSVGRTSIEYSVIKSDITGPIYNTNLIYGGQRYKKVPSISIASSTGKDANLIPITSTIGKINKIESISNTFFPSDKTLKPYSKLYSALYLTNNYEVSKINLTFGGANYLSAPNIKIYNQNTNEIVSDFTAYGVLSSTSIRDIVVTSKGSGLSKDGNKVIFTENTNGIKILDATYTENLTGFLVTLRLETPITGFTTSSPMPFKLNDEIFVEGIVSLGSGYNSSDYSYNNFNIVGISTAYGSQDQATITYEVDNDPGALVSLEFAYVVPAKYMPQCELFVKEGQFFSNEEVNNSKVVNNIYDPIDKLTVNVYDSSSLKVGDNIVGENSKSKGTIIKINEVDADFIVSSSKSKSIGWLKQRGNLSEIVQKLPDNDYYQNLSYSLKSTIQNLRWESPVSDLTHISGLKKFGDVIVESNSDDPYSIVSSQNSNITISLNSYVDINTINNFDLVLEDVDDHNQLYSEILTFKSTKLSDYILSVNNRVLSIDDISSNFNTDSDFSYLVVDALPTFGTGSLIAKYFTFVESTTSIFTDFELPLLVEIYMSRNSNNVNLLTYSYFEDIPLGTFISEINPNNSGEVLLEFIPSNVYNIINARTIRDEVSLVVGSTMKSCGNLRTLTDTSTFAAEEVPTQKLISLQNIEISECTAGNVYVGISSIEGSIEEYSEFTFLYNPGNLIQSVYAENEVKNLGTIGITTNYGGDILITYDGVPNTEVHIYIHANLLVNTFSNPNLETLEYGKITSSNLQFTASNLNPVAISTVSKDYGASKYVIEVEKTVGVTTQKSLIQINSVHYDVDSVQEKYLNNVNYGIIGNFDDLEFSTIFDQVNGNYILSYYPSELATYNIKFYQKSILRATNPLL